MIKLEKLNVKKFRNISSAEIEVGDFNVLIGPNNSGKSNLLQIMNYLKFILNGGTNEVKSYFEGNGRGSSNLIPLTDSGEHKSGESSFQLVFSNQLKNQIYFYELKINWKPDSEKNFLYRLKISYENLSFKERNKPGPPTNIFVREFNKVNYGQTFSKTQNIETIPDYTSVTRLLEFISLDNELYVEAIKCLNIILSTKTYYFSNIQLLKDFTEKNVYDNLGRIIAIDMRDEIIKLSVEKFNILKTILKDTLKIDDIRIFNFPIPDPNKAKKEEFFKFIFFNHFNTLKFYNTLSDGSILLVALITKILGSQDHIFFIEEPENSLHPQALKKLINFLKSYGSENQYIIATHSLVLVNSINPDDAIVACVDKDGQTNFQNVSNLKDLKKKMKESFLDFSDYIFYEDFKNSSFKDIDL